jgi:hypothetical protein
MRPVSLVVIGDTHLAPGPRQADKVAALKQILQHGLALEGQLGAWLWPGDLFHSTSTILDRNVLKDIVLCMASAAPVVICYGNHDAPGDLDIFADLRAMHAVHVIAQPQVLELDLATSDHAAIFVLPYPHKGGLVGSGIAHDDLGQIAQQLLEPVFINAAAELEAAAAAGALTVFIGHVNIGGASASTGQPQIGREIELDPALLARLGDIPKFVNHIHLPQFLHGAYIPGSIAAMDFGEMEEKRFLVAQATFGEGVNGVAWRIESVPLAVAHQYHIEGALTRDGFTYQVTKGPGGATCPTPATWAGADIRVRFTYRKGEYNPLQQAHIHAEFAGCRSLKVEGTPIREDALRAPEVIAAVSLTDKLRRFCEISGEKWTTGLAEKVDALQHLDAEQLVARWHDREYSPAQAETAVL